MSQSCDGMGEDVGPSRQRSRAFRRSRPRRIWWEERDLGDRDEIVADIEELLEDLTVQGITELPAIRYRDVDPLLTDIRAFKDGLRRLVDEKGGISCLADRARIPQPSPSRFFGQASLPQRGTLLKLRDALSPDGDALIDGWLK